MKKVYLSLYLSLLATSMSFGQQSYSLSFDEVKSKVLEENLDLKTAEQLFKEAQGDFRQTNSLLMPSVSVSHTALTTTNPLMAFGFKLNQEQLTAADFNPDLLNNPNQIETFATRLEVVQPLINLDGFLARSAAKLKMEATELQALRAREYMELGVFQAFKQLELTYELVDVYQKAKETADAHYKLVSDYVNEGLAKENDRLMVAVRVSEMKSALAHAKRLLNNASDRIFLMMNMDPEGRVILPQGDSNTTVSGSEDQSIDTRKDIQAYAKATEAYQKMYQSSSLSLAPRLNAFANYEMYDTEAFQTSAKGYTIGAQLSWNVFDGFKSAGKIQKAKAQYLKAQFQEEAYLDQSKAELAAAERQRLDAKNQLELAELSLNQAKEAFRIVEDRFKEGLEKTSDLLLVETQFYQKQLAYQQALFNLELSNQLLYFLTR